MPLIRSIVASLTLTCSVSLASIEDLEQRFYSEDAFTRISEYFNGQEISGNRTILRTNPASRTGHYITFLLSARYDIGHFKLDVYEPGSPTAKEYIFKPNAPVDPTQPVYLGLTGDKWLEKANPPVAYKLSLIGKNGDVLQSASSFLWGDD